MEIELSKCKLRPFRESDAESLVRHANNRKVWLNLRDGFPHPYTIEDAKNFFSRVAEMEGKVFAIEVDGQAVGGIGFYPKEDVYRKTAELGYWLSEAYWNRGIVSEAVQAITEYALREFDLTRVFAMTYEWNPASARVLEKCGFEYEGRMKKSAFKDGKVIDQLLWAKVKE